ncbi:MAG: hypothetical protein IIX99_00035, partial [Oscillospiraceae bacterium]|nr:hypothetical protein [Oscillospiraceae bacterium]
MPNTEPMNSPAKKKMLYKSYINSISARSYEPDKTDAGGQLDALLSTYGIFDAEASRKSNIFALDQENGFVALTDVSNDAILNRLRSGEVLLISDSSGFPRSLSAMQLDGTEYLQCMSPEEAFTFHASRDQYFADKAEIIPPEEPDLLTIICNFFVELLFGHYSKGMQEWIQYRDLFMKQEGIDTFMHSEAVTARQTEADQRLQEQVRMIQQQQQQEQEQEPQPQQEQEPQPQQEEVNANNQQNENSQQKEDVSEQQDEKQAEGEEEKKEEEQPAAVNEEIEPVEKKEEAPAVEDKKEEPAVEDKKEESVVEDKKDEPAAEVKKDEPVTEVKKDEKPAAYNPIVAYSKDTNVLRSQLKMAQDYQNRLAAAEQMIREKQERERQKEELLRKKQEEKRRLDEEKEKKKWEEAIKKSEEIDPNLKGELERIEQRKKEFSERVRAEKRQKKKDEKVAQAVRIRERREAMNPLKTSEDYAREQRRLDKLIKEEIEAVKEHLAFERRLAELQQKRLELADPQRVEARKKRMEQLSRMMVERDMSLAYLAKVCFENRENEFEANVPKRFEDLKADQKRRDDAHR